MRRVALLVLGVALAVSACGSEDEETATQPRVAKRVEASGLVFRRADGSRIDFPGRVVAWCGPWNYEEIPARALHIAAIEGVERSGQQWFSYWRVWAIVEDVRGGKPVRFPNRFVWNKPRGAEIFVGDFPTENETSTKQEQSSGQIAFEEATCELDGRVEFTLDVVVGSEFGDREPIVGKGSFSGVVSEPPAGY
jgi:hypothetical protein